MKSKNNKSRILLAALAALLVVLIAVIAVILVQSRMKESHYEASYEEAEKYLAEANYEQAIISYKNAIQTDPGKEGPYLALAEIYMNQNDYSKARSILTRGYEMTNSSRIAGRLSILEDEDVELVSAGGTDSSTANGTVKTAPADIKTASSKLRFDSSLLQKVKNYTFADFKREFGSVTDARKGDDDYLEVRHDQLGAVLYYKNTDYNRDIVDSSRNVPYDTAQPEKISFDTLDEIFNNFEGAASLNRMQMVFGLRVQPQTEDGQTYIQYDSEDLVVKIETDKSGNVVSNEAWNSFELPLANSEEEEEAEGEVGFMGVVIDATDGSSIPGAQLTLSTTDRSRGNASDGGVVTTDSSGEFEGSFTAASYSLTITAPGYIEESFDVDLSDGESQTGLQYVLSPELTEEVRIVLEWNAEPRDLDSHLNGAVDGGSTFHVYYGNKRTSYNGSTAAELDLDDTSSYGPETITISNLNGVYTYSVVDFTRSRNMAEYGATVKVYLPGESVQTFELYSEKGTGNTWELLKLDHGRLELIDHIY
ncbi:MAG: carboxypeptidase regulatory-like domain-containing protein [Lachnospiraceae bacterium]|nr:carboxypeptidase regulatory-like domain-containing protein [Lachnospiraceae bacterium]